MMPFWRKRKTTPPTDPVPPVADDWPQVVKVACPDCFGTGRCLICNDETQARYAWLALGRQSDAVASCGCDNGECTTCCGDGTIRKAVG